VMEENIQNKLMQKLNTFDNKELAEMDEAAPILTWAFWKQWFNQCIVRLTNLSIDNIDFGASEVERLVYAYTVQLGSAHASWQAMAQKVAQMQTVK